MKSSSRLLLQRAGYLHLVTSTQATSGEPRPPLAPPASPSNRFCATVGEYLAMQLLANVRHEGSVPGVELAKYPIDGCGMAP